MDWLFGAFGFFATGMGVVATIAVAALIILIWEWRVALVGLFVVQFSVATFGVLVHDVPAQWGTTHILVMLLSTMILALSVVQARSSRSLHQAANWLFRLFGIAVVFMAWRLASIQVALPEFPPNQVTYMIALAICSLVIFSLGDNPFFTAVALLLWMIPIQLFIEVLLPEPTVIAMIGGLQLLLALTCGYLILADRVPRNVTQLVMTDITFPDSIPPVNLVDDDNTIVPEPFPGLPKGFLTDRRTDGLATSSIPSLPPPPPSSPPTSFPPSQTPPGEH
jgi:hypothetical protein